MKCAIAGCTRDATPGFQRCEPCANGVPVPSSSALLSAPAIAALRAMLAEATPGPWDVDCPSGRTIYAGYVARNSEGDDIGRECEVGETTTRDDAAAIVAVTNAATAMLDEIERLRAALDAAESALAHLRGIAGHAAAVAVHGDPLAGAVGTIGPKVQR